MKDRKHDRLVELEDLAQEVGQLLQQAMGDSGAGFCLLLFDFGEGGWMTYTSNSERKTMVSALAEFEQAIAAGLDSPHGGVAPTEPPTQPT